MENKNLNTPQTAEYDTHFDTLNAFLEHSKGKGYGIVLGNVLGLNRQDRKGGRHVTFACDRHGTYQKRINVDIHTSKRRKTTSSRKCGCPFHIEAIEDPITKKCYVILTTSAERLCSQLTGMEMYTINITIIHHLLKLQAIRSTVVRP